MTTTNRQSTNDQLDAALQWDFTKFDLKTCSLDELEILAIMLYTQYRDITHRIINQYPPRKEGKDFLLIEKVPSLDAVLEERKKRLNADFKFTPKTVSRFVKINDMLAEALKRARHEARPIMKNLEKRLKNKDSFLKDYEIDLLIQPFIATNVIFLGPPGIYEVLENIIHRHSPFLKRPKTSLEGYYKYGKVEPLGARDRYRGERDRCNWSKHSTLLGNVFVKHHICYLMHELCEYTYWSLPDILRIKQIWADVTVSHQHHTPLRFRSVEMPFNLRA